MSAVEATKPVEAGTVEPAPAPVVASDNAAAPVVAAEEAPKVEEVPKTETTEAAAPAAVEEEKKETKPEEKPVEPITSGALGYKAPGLKNAFRYSKKYFWFGEEAVPAGKLDQYLRGEKPEVAHPIVAWSSQTGKGLVFFVKHADQKEHPAGALNLAYATDLVKDGTIAFHLKLHGHKHSFEAQTAPERNGWFVAFEKAIAEAKEAKEGIESSEGFKEQKEKLAKPAPLAAAAASTTPKKSTDATPKAAETEAPATTEPAVEAPARAGSSSSSSSDEEKKAKKAKSKSRSVSRGKRASIFGGFLGKKDKEPKEEAESSKVETEAKKEDAAPQIAEATTTAPVITADIPKVEETKPETTTEAPVVAPVAAPVEETKVEETPKSATEEKPKPTKRGSIFGNFVEKLKSPKEEKKEADLVAPAVPAKDEPVAATEETKPVEEAVVAAPVAAAKEEPATIDTAAAAKTEESKPAAAATSTPSKEKEHFSFGKFFGSKDRAKSPAPVEKAAEPKAETAAPKVEETPAVAAPAPVAETVAEPVAATETKAEPVEAKKEEKPVEAKKEETPKKEKRGSIFGQLSRSISKATGKKDTKKEEKKETPAVVPEATEETKTETPAVAATEAKTETPAVAAPAPAEKTIGDVPAEAVTVGEPKSTPTVATTA